MARLDFDEASKALDLEFFCDRESLAYKLGRGTSGMQINAKRCPECGDTRYRVYLNAESGVGNCFVCNESFSKLKFVRLSLNLEWRELHGPLSEILREQGWRPKRMNTAAVDFDKVVLPYSDALPLEDGANLLYLEQRGVTAELAAYFHLRWCQHGWWKFKDETGATQMQTFSNRVVIPVFDLDGELMTFQGRDLTGTSDRKYKFPTGLPGTGRFLFNGQNVHLTEDVAVGEGAFDVIAQKIAYDEDVDMRHIVPVGTFGKKLSYGSLDGNDQLGRFIKLKAGGVKRATIMWDGEEKALVAALNAAKLLTGIGLIARVALLPPDKDPNEVLPEVVRKAFYEARTWSPKLDVQWRLRNPYSRAQRGKYFPVSAD